MTESSTAGKCDISIYCTAGLGNCAISCAISCAIIWVQNSTVCLTEKILATERESHEIFLVIRLRNKRHHGLQNLLQTVVGL